MTAVFFEKKRPQKFGAYKNLITFAPAFKAKFTEGLAKRQGTINNTFRGLFKQVRG